MSDLKFTRRETIAALGATVALPLLAKASPVFAQAKAPATDAQASALLNSVAENLLRLGPEGATSLGIDTGPRAWMRSRLSDHSAAGVRAVAATVKADLARVEAIDESRLSFPVRTSVDTVRSAYRTALEGFAFPYGDVAVGGYRNTPYVVIQNVGAYIDTPNFLDTDHPVETASDAEAYLSRLAQYPRQLDGELERLRSARARGRRPARLPRRQDARSARHRGEERARGRNPRRLARPPGEGEEHSRATGMLAPARSSPAEVAPALERQIAELQAERAVAKDVAGVWALPHGPEYYRWALKASTTTNLTPDEVHQMGLEQLKELQGRMDPILKSLGYAQGSIGDRMKALAKDPKYKFSEGDKGRAEIMAYIQERLRIIRAVLPRAFGMLVPGHLEVKRMSPEQEPGAPAAYGGAGSIDGKIPGKFWINLRDTNLHSKYSLPDLASHEAIPGHVWQGEYANKLPLIRTLLAFNAYSEGWALYAEQLVDELGVYDDFPAGRLGYLQSIAFRCCRLVVDSGLHAKRWTRQQAVDFFVNVNGSNPLEVASEVDRYCAWPGQACGYKVGHSTIVGLRDKAKGELGPKFDLRQFDDAVVMGGNVPMDVLAKNVDDYIARTKA